MTLSEQEVLARIEARRRRRPMLREDRVTLAHGAGGKATRALVEALFVDAFDNPVLAPLEDQARLTVDGAHLAFTTDSFVVSPLFFPGGDIGELAVNGTINDLAVGGADPVCLSAAFILEEGFPIDDLRRIAASMAAAARDAGVPVVTGDTKVVQRGKGDGCYINTTGVGVRRRALTLGAERARPGDVVLVSGPIGDHGITIMLARGELDIEAEIESDTAPLHRLAAALLDAAPGTRCMRDPTRGGVATVLNEIALASGTAITLEEPAIPVRPEVTGACEILGIDPLYVANEGRLIAIVPPDEADRAIAAMRADVLGTETRAIGSVGEDPPGMVLLRTSFGGTRIVDVLVGDPLPRIC